MLKFKLAVCLVLGASVAACGGSSEPGPAADGRPGTASPGVPAAGAESSGMACAHGGSACPAGLECLTWRDGNRACGPMAAPGVVMIEDVTLGGSCLSPDPADTWPGASIASVEVIGVGGNREGRGRMVWDRAGFETAAQRGSPPDGSEVAGDACTAAYNLGCDGRAIFEILDDDDGVRKLREGEMIIVQLRGQDTCGEEVADEVAAAVCSEPEAAAAGDLESCTFKVRMVKARSDLYGPDRQGGTIGYFTPD